MYYLVQLFNLTTHIVKLIQLRYLFLCPHTPMLAFPLLSSSNKSPPYSQEENGRVNTCTSMGCPLMGKE